MTSNLKKASRLPLFRTAVLATLAATAVGCEGQPVITAHGIDIQLNPDGSLACLSRSASLLAFSDTAITLNGKGKVGGAVVLLGHSTLTAGGNARVGDAVYGPSSHFVTLHGKAEIGQFIERDLSAAEPLLIDALNAIDKRVATRELESIRTSTTLKSNGGVNVVQVDGDLALSGKDKLILDGDKTDSFIISVRGDLSFSGNANMSLQGGVLPQNILIRVTGATSKISVTGSGSLFGTLVAPRGSAKISGNGVLKGALFAQQNIQISGNGFTFDPAPFCPFWKAAPAPLPSPSETVTPAPEPSPTSTTTPSPAPDPSPTSTTTPDDLFPGECANDSCAPVLGV